MHPPREKTRTEKALASPVLKLNLNLKLVLKLNPNLVLLKPIRV